MGLRSQEMVSEQVPLNALGHGAFQHQDRILAKPIAADFARCAALRRQFIDQVLAGPREDGAEDPHPPAI